MSRTNEFLCEDIKKIYFNGKCICDFNKGYYPFNNNIDNKCYKKEELTKNVYFNNLNKTYELCYWKCATCEKGGNNSENNCLTCINNYVKEPNYSSNCVAKCNFLYYYNSLNQYRCTDDEQCPDEASLIVRIKEKCVNKCTNDDTNIYQYNGECLTSCPPNTTINNFNICQLNNTSVCSSSDFKLEL